MHADKAVAAVTQALAEFDGIPINQTILKQSEAAVDAAQCSELSPDEEILCKLDRGHECPHQWVLMQALEDREQLATALDALIDIYGHSDDPVVKAIQGILDEHGRSVDAGSSRN